MLNLLLLTGRSNGLTTNPNFDVISCNNADNYSPELTLSIKKDYLDTNLSWLASQAGFIIYRIQANWIPDFRNHSKFTLTDDENFYKKVIPENELDVNLDDKCK